MTTAIVLVYVVLALWCARRWAGGLAWYWHRTETTSRVEPSGDQVFGGVALGVLLATVWPLVSLALGAHWVVGRAGGWQHVLAPDPETKRRRLR